MVARKKPQTAAVKDSSEADNKSLRVLALPTGQFNNIIHSIKVASPETVKQLRHATFHRLRKLGVVRDTGKAVTAAPRRGSAQLDVGTIVAWIGKVTPDETDAVAQLVAIDATLVARGT